MIISPVERREEGGWSRIEAVFTYENTSRSPDRLWFSSSLEDGLPLAASSDAFVIAGAALATWRGENRVRVDGLPPCPVLSSNAVVWIQTLADCLKIRPPTLEVDTFRPAAPPRENRQTAGLISGGVDSLALFQSNLRDFPSSHRQRIQAGLTLFGLHHDDCPSGEINSGRYKTWIEKRQRFSELLASSDIPIIGLMTNLRSLVPNYHVWSAYLHSVLHFAAVHALADRWHTAWMASDGLGIGQLEGILPDISSLAGSTHLQFPTIDLQLTRLDKVRALLQWPEALAIVQPCHEIDLLPTSRLNCGRCEKCIRTLLCLLICGDIQRSPAFDVREIHASDIRDLDLHGIEGKEIAFGQLIQPLQAIGRYDLSFAIRERIFRSKMQRYFTMRRS